MLEFGVPSKRKTKVDEYAGQSVLIMHKLPEGKKKSRKFELSKDGAALLGYTKGGNIAISFKGTDIFLARVDDEFAIEDMKLTNKFIFSNVKVYNYISELLSLDNTKNVMFNLISEDCSEMYGINGLVKLNLINKEVEMYDLKEVNEDNKEQMQKEYQDMEQVSDNATLEA